MYVEKLSVHWYFPKKKRGRGLNSTFSENINMFLICLRLTHKVCMFVRAMFRISCLYGRHFYIKYQLNFPSSTCSGLPPLFPFPKDPFLYFVKRNVSYFVFEMELSPLSELFELQFPETVCEPFRPHRCYIQYAVFPQDFPKFP